METSLVTVEIGVEASLIPKKWHGKTTIEYLLKGVHVSVPEKPVDQPLLSICSKEYTSAFQRHLLTALLFPMANVVEPRCSGTDEWVKKAWLIFTVYYFFSHIEE